MKNLHQSINQFKKCVIIFSIALSISLPVSTFATGSSIRMGKIITSNDTTVSTNTTLIQDSVLAVADKMPEYPGGNDAKFKFLAGNIRYPDIATDKNQQGRVIVQFVVSKTGKVKNAKVVKSISPSLDKEALRVVNSFPKWIPGEQNGVPIDVYQLIPVTFKLDTIIHVYRPKTVWTVNDKTMIIYNGKKMPADFDVTGLEKDKIASIAIIKPFPEFAKQKLILQYGQEAENGVMIINDKNVRQTTDSLRNFINIDDDNYVFAKAEKMPQFTGGSEKAIDFIKSHLTYPSTAKLQGIQGKVLIEFVIDKSGKIRDPRIIQKVDPILDDEALDVISSFPNWLPGEQNGKKINAFFTLPFTFELNEQKNILDSNGNKVYSVIEQMPQYPGGVTELMKFISHNIKYPIVEKENNIQGSVIIRFIVNSLGKVEKPEITKGLDPQCDKEALRVINLLPDFIPGKQHGQNVSVYYVLPIRF